MNKKIRTKINKKQRTLDEDGNYVSEKEVVEETETQEEPETEEEIVVEEETEETF